MALRLEGRVANLFDTQTVLSVNRIQYNGRLRGRHVDLTAIGPQGTSKPNALFGTPTAWASPRRFMLTAYFDF